jgi:nicotinate-nucleotide adenylyltransferase
MRIGVFGGTFNPPHSGHLAAARHACDALELDRIVFVPAGVPPHKKLPAGSASALQRAEMTELAADSLLLPGLASVSRMEVERSGPSYTADSLAAIRGEEPNAELFLLMGSDMLFYFPRWQSPQAVAEIAAIAAFCRASGESEEPLFRQKQLLERDYGARIILLHPPEIIDISSTELRKMLPAGRGGDLLPPAVYGYILRNNLYGTKADLKRLADPELRAVSYSMIKAKRIAHIQGTELEAVRLAGRWNADAEAARRAAILHDITKYLSLDEQLKLCRKYGIVLDELERKAVKLLHAQTGAALAQDMFGVSGPIYEAIRWHTTGKPDMSLLEKVIYLADYIEPTRSFDGVERLRALAYENLDGALLLGLEMTVTEMEAMGNPVHEKTLKAIDWLKGSKHT